MVEPLARRGKIEPAQIVFKIEPRTETAPQGPGEPPIIIDVGGGLEDHGGSRIPPRPTAESGENESERRRRDAWRFKFMWAEDQYYTNAETQNGAIGEMAQLLSRSGLLAHAKTVVLQRYIRSIIRQQVPTYTIPVEAFGIDTTSDGLGIFSPAQNILRAANLSVFQKEVILQEVYNLPGTPLNDWANEITTGFPSVKDKHEAGILGEWFRDWLKQAGRKKR